MRKKLNIINAALIFIVAYLTIVFIEIMYAKVPKYHEFFISLHVMLPGLTVMFIDLSRSIRAYLIMFMPLIFFSFIAMIVFAIIAKNKVAPAIVFSVIAIVLSGIILLSNTAMERPIVMTMRVTGKKLSRAGINKAKAVIEKGGDPSHILK